MAIREIAKPLPPVADSADPNPRAVIGGNKPPVTEVALAEFNAELAEISRKLEGMTIQERVTSLVESAGRAKCENDDDASRVATLLKQMKAAVDAIGTAHDTAKRPYLDGGNAITNAKKNVLGKLETEYNRVRGMGDAYMRQKRAKEEADAREAERQRQQLRDKAEADAQAERDKAAQENRAPDETILAAPIEVASKPIVAPSSQVRSEFGGMMSMSTTKVGNIVDWKKAFGAVKDQQDVMDAIQRAVNRLIKAKVTKIPGVEIVDDATLRVR